MCVPRVSECELEVDALAVDIMNREQTSVGEWFINGHDGDKHLSIVVLFRNVWTIYR